MRGFDAKGTRRWGLVAFVAVIVVAMVAALAIANPGDKRGVGPNKALTKKKKGPLRDVLVVSNNWDGTVDLVDPRTFQRLKRVNVVPDREERVASIQSNPVDFGYFLAVRNLIGEGHDQLADDGFTSKDGRTLYISRPSFVDVVAIDIASGNIIWRTELAGQRSDHMAISPDGTKLVVSASTANIVQELDTATGKITGQFESGDSPHENNYSKDGSTIFHASIGLVYTPTDAGPLSSTKGERYFQIVDAKTLEVRQRIDMGQKLAEAGYPDMSSAVRPMAISPDEKFVYLQVSFFHGFAEYEIATGKIRRVHNLPLSEKAAGLRRDEYVLDSAHHGIDMNPQGTQLCVAGTMSDYAAIVDRDDFASKIVTIGDKPYWSTSDETGKNCFVSVSGEDRVAVISFAKGKEIASIPVGDHPQRMRRGEVRRASL